MIIVNATAPTTPRALGDCESFDAMHIRSSDVGSPRNAQHIHRRCRPPSTFRERNAREQTRSKGTHYCTLKLHRRDAINTLNQGATKSDRISNQLCVYKQILMSLCRCDEAPDAPDRRGDEELSDFAMALPLAALHHASITCSRDLHDALQAAR